MSKIAALDSAQLEPISMTALIAVVGGDRVVTQNDLNHRILNAWDEYAARMKYTTKAGMEKLNAIKMPVRRF